MLFFVKSCTYSPHGRGDASRASALSARDQEPRSIQDSLACRPVGRHRAGLAGRSRQGDRLRPGLPGLASVPRSDHPSLRAGNPHRILSPFDGNPGGRAGAGDPAALLEAPPVPRLDRRTQRRRYGLGHRRGGPRRRHGPHGAGVGRPPGAPCHSRGPGRLHGARGGGRVDGPPPPAHRRAQKRAPPTRRVWAPY